VKIDPKNPLGPVDGSYILSAVNHLNETVGEDQVGKVLVALASVVEHAFLKDQNPVFDFCKSGNSMYLYIGTCGIQAAAAIDIEAKMAEGMD
jgi:hypothetical protein